MLRQIEEALSSSKWYRRVWAARKLAGFPQEESPPLLRRALHDSEDTGVTQAAMETLLVIGTPDAEAMLLDALVNGEEETAEHLHRFLESEGSEGSDLAFAILDAYDGLENESV